MVILMIIITYTCVVIYLLEDMAFRQSLARLAPGLKRADVHPALVKAWSKHYKVIYYTILYI